MHAVSTSQVADIMHFKDKAYYYTLYTFDCLIAEIRIYCLITTFHFLIFTSIIYN